MEPIAAGDVVVKFSGSMGSEWEISKITNMSPDEVKKLLYDMARLMRMSGTEIIMRI